MKQKCENEKCSKFGEVSQVDFPAESGAIACYWCGETMTPLVDRADHNFVGWQEITEDLYMYFLNVLPPSFGPSNTFAVGEPLRHNEFGRAVFTICRRVDNKFYCIEGTLEAMFFGALGSPKNEILPTVQKPVVSG